jgi:hypothetical protein
MKIFLLILISAMVSIPALGRNSMRRCTLLPVIDDVGGAIGFRVYEELEKELKNGQWCTYISHSSLMSVFGKYRESLPRFLKRKEVLEVVAQKLQVGSIILLSLKNEINSMDLEMEVYGEDEGDLYFSEKVTIESNEIENIVDVAKNWFSIYAKTIPYDARITGVLGSQVTLDVGKGYAINEGQEFIVKRPMTKKKHPLLKKIVDWETELVTTGTVLGISENQALGLISEKNSVKAPVAGDWIRLKDFKKESQTRSSRKKKDKEPLLGVASLMLYTSSAVVDTSVSSGVQSVDGFLYGLDLALEGWITRDYVGVLEFNKSFGSLSTSSGSPAKNHPQANFQQIKIGGGYRYLPLGYFFGPQIDFKAGYSKSYFDLTYSALDGYGQSSVHGLFLSTKASLPLNRDFRILVNAEFIPFPEFNDDDGLFQGVKNASSMEFEFGLRYNYVPAFSLDMAIETLSSKARVRGNISEISFKETRLKFGSSFNF